MRALLLAGGRGERLYPLTQSSPKPMLRVAGKPILEWQIEWLRRHGMLELTLCTSYLRETIREFFQEGARFNIAINYSEEVSPLGTGGAISKAWDLRGNESVVAINGDIITDLDLGEMLERHRRTRAKATLAISRPHLGYGVVNIDDSSGRILGFDEKPELPYHINAGIYILEPECRKYFPSGVSSIEYDVFPRLVQEGSLYAYRSNGLWMSIDSFKDYQNANKIMSAQTHLGLGRE